MDSTDYSLTASPVTTVITCVPVGDYASFINDVEITYIFTFVYIPPVLKAYSNQLSYTIAYTIGSGPVTVTPLCVFDPVTTGYTVDYTRSDPT